MALFGTKACSQCAQLQEELDALKQYNEKLTSALQRLKIKYDESVAEDTKVTASADEVTALFQAIKNSSHTSDMKRYLRSVLMLVKETQDATLYTFLHKQLRAD